MTTISVPVTPNLRNQAQGPHSLGPTDDGGYFARLRDVPTGLGVEYEPGILRLVFEYDGERDPQTELEMFSAFNPHIDGLELQLYYSKQGRRPHSARFVGFDAFKVAPAQLVNGLHAALAALGTSGVSGESEQLSPQDVLFIKAVGIMCTHMMKKVVEDLRDHLRGASKRKGE